MTYIHIYHIPEPSADDLSYSIPEWYENTLLAGDSWQGVALRRAYHAERKLAELQAEMRSHVCDAAPKLAALEKRIADIRREVFEEAAQIAENGMLGITIAQAIRARMEEEEK